RRDSAQGSLGGAHMEGPGQQHGAIARRPADHPAGPVRGGQHRRRQPVAPVPLCHSARTATDARVRGRDGHHLPVPKLCGDIRPDIRGAPELHHHGELSDLHRGLRLLQHGLGLSDGLRAVRLHCRAHVGGAPSPEGTLTTTHVRTARKLLPGSCSARGLFVNFVLLLAATLLVLFPSFWMLTLAFTPADEAFRYAKSWPATPTFEN